METYKKSKNLIDSIVACINSCDDGIYTDNRNDNIIKFGGKIGMYQIITHDRCSLLFTELSKKYNIGEDIENEGINLQKNIPILIFDDVKSIDGVIKYLNNLKNDFLNRKKFNFLFFYFYFIFMNDNLFGLTKEDIFNICINSEFPGSSRWEPENPIWDSFLPGYKSPKDAWKDEKLLMDGIKNMFWILEKSIRENKYENFVERHKKAFDMAKEGNISMLTSLVLTRFTVAKIAPKVTALSPTTWIKIINDSGIDLGKYAGIYCPMAGFGGIIEGAKRWYDEKGESYEGKIESYDINKSFVDYYHWDGVRDMLAQKIETDKICIVCPPFGKEYEHWKGTPDEMSDITYLEWHHLVHEYVKAPEYIIMGPELKENSKDLDTKGKKFNGLFRKRVGVQLWTDELWKKVCDMTPAERKKEGLKF